jgi:hypothetical protein
VSDHDDKQDDERVDDLDVPASESDEVKGGSLNTYISKPVGEKQGSAAPHRANQGWGKWE